jgi:hypothetical protein
VFDIELLGTGVGSLALAGTLIADRLSSSPRIRTRSNTPVYVTRGLLDVLCEMAADAEPADCRVGLATTPVARLSGRTGGLPPETPVYTHFYMPDVAESTRAVFGIDLGTPPGRTRGLFVSRSQRRLVPTARDDLHRIVLVAAPPWDQGSVAAFDRSGREHPLRVLDVVPPEETLHGTSLSDGPTGL